MPVRNGMFVAADICTYLSHPLAIKTGRHGQKKWPIYSKQLMNVSLKGSVFLYHGLLKVYNNRISLSALLLFLEIPNWVFFWEVISLTHFLRDILSDPLLTYMDN